MDLFLQRIFFVQLGNRALYWRGSGANVQHSLVLHSGHPVGHLSSISVEQIFSTLSKCISIWPLVYYRWLHKINPFGQSRRAHAKRPSKTSIGVSLTRFQWHHFVSKMRSRVQFVFVVFLQFLHWNTICYTSQTKRSISCLLQHSDGTNRPNV